MADIALDYDELLDSGGKPWRRRLILGGAALLVAATGAYFAWDQWIRSGSGVAAPVYTEATVSTGNITKTISTSGTVSAAKTSNLNFSSAGKVTKVDVALGQQVKQGDVLAEIDPTDAQNALKTAQASLASAEARLQTLIQGSTASQLASADQSVVQAQASYDKAVQTLTDLQKPADQVTLQTAQQAVTSAQAKLASAQEARANLDTSAANDVSKAKDNLTKAKDTLVSAKQALDDADATVSTDQGALYNAETAYCGAYSDTSFCASHSAPVSDSDVSTLVNATNGSDATQAQAAQKVLSANSTYRSAVTSRDKADTAVSDAQTGVSNAQDALDAAEAEPSSAQIGAANAAVSGAQVDLASANQKLADLLAGPTQEDLHNAQSAIDQAAASLKSAQAKRDETYAGSASADIQSQRSSVQQAQVSVDNAQKTVDDTHLKAPFDGTVAALNIQVGDSASTSGGGTSSTAAIVLNTPDLVVLNLTIAETDYPGVKPGDGGYAVFSAIPNGISPFVIDSIGVNPTTTQGVVTYQAKAHIVTGQQAIAILQSILPSGTGGNRSGAAASGTPGAATTPRANRTPQAGRTPGAGRTGGGAGGFGGGAGASAGSAAASNPAPGMNASVTIIVDQRTGVVMVPSKAVQTSGRTSSVIVKNADSTTQNVTVTTGLSDATNTEILSGLADGQTIEIPGKVTTTTTTAPAATGGFGGFGGFGGGGGGGGRGGGGD